MTQLEGMALRKGDRVRGIVSGVCGTVIDARNNSVRVRWDHGGTEWVSFGTIDGVRKDGRT